MGRLKPPFFLTMGQTNATVIQEDKTSDVKIAVNSIQTAAYVKRICIDPVYGEDDHYHYDIDDLYPQKIISIKERSWALSSATKTLSDFITGDSFADETLNDLVLNSEGITGYDILRAISDQKSQFGFSLQFNYDLSGRVTEINEIDFEDLRVKQDGSLDWCEDWASPYARKKINYKPFNPDTALAEIGEVGLDKYTGQVLYWTGTNKRYPLARFDAALDSGQYQAESELFKLRNIQNDFSSSGVLKYPKNLDSDAEFTAVKKKIKGGGVGANNSGKIVLMGVTPDTEGTSSNMWESFDRKGVDKLFVEQNKDSKEIIFSVFRQPSILSAIIPGGGFANMQEMEDAFVYYNSIVEQDRKEVEKTLSKVFDVSIWGAKNTEIKPKVLIRKEDVEVTEEETKPVEETEDGVE